MGTGAEAATEGLLLLKVTGSQGAIPHVLLQCLSYLTDKAHAGTGDKIQRSTLSYINL